MVMVKKERSESTDKMIRRFQKKIKKSGLMRELRDRRFYKKPSEKRKDSARRRANTLKKLAEEKQATS